MNTPQAQAAARAEISRRKLIGEIAPRAKGERSHGWKGGLVACRTRRRESGKQAAERRAYCKANPDKVREWVASRKRRKFGRLPRGTVARLRLAQKGRCAICRVRLPAGFHADHIMPLARDGLHESRNIQLLCQPCNSAKSSRDPIDHMRSLGRLL
ncbi:MAG: HNH endonuclease [Brevundimonas sp.]